MAGTVLAGLAVGAILVLPRSDGPARQATPAATSGPTPATTSTAPVVDTEYRNASQMLTAAAAAAGRQDDPLGDAPYWKVVTQNGNDASSRSTRWYGIDGPGVMPFAPDPEHPTDLYEQMPQYTVRLGGHTYTWREVNDGAVPVSELPGLLTEKELSPAGGRSDPGRDHDRYFFKEAYEVLANTPASPAIRKTLWSAVAAIDGVELDGRVTDSIGRPGWAVSLTSDGFTTTYIVDPTSGALLEARWRPEGPEPADPAGQTFVESGPAASAPSPTPREKLVELLPR